MLSSDPPFPRNCIKATFIQLWIELAAPATAEVVAYMPLDSF